MDRVLLVIQPSASHYRAPLIRELLNSQSMRFTLLGTHSNRGIEDSANLIMNAGSGILSNVSPIQEKKLIGHFSWQHGILKKVIQERASIYVFEGNPYKLSTWVAMAIAKLKGAKVVLWGHGWRRPDFGAKRAVRKYFYSLAAGHLIYGDWAKNYAKEIGLDPEKFYPVYNSIYPRAVIESMLLGCETPADPEPHERTLSLIFSGRLTKRHEVSLLVMAVSHLRSEGFEVALTVVGDGEARSELEKLAGEHASAIRFAGSIYDIEQLRELYRDADFAVSPGASGLNVIQGLGFGVPVIAADGHEDSGPEVEAVIDGVTGILFEAGSVNDLVCAIRMADQMTAETYRSHKAASVDLVSKKYTAESHSRAIQNALVQINASRPPTSLFGAAHNRFRAKNR